MAAEKPAFRQWKVGGWTETRPVSLGLLPSGPDPVGEWCVHRQPPGPYLAHDGGERKAGDRLGKAAAELLSCSLFASCISRRRRRYFSPIASNEKCVSTKLLA